MGLEVYSPLDTERTLQMIEIHYLGHTTRFHQVMRLMAMTRLFTWTLWIESKDCLYQTLCGDRTKLDHLAGGVFWDVDSLVHAILKPKTDLD